MASGGGLNLSQWFSTWGFKPPRVLQDHFRAKVVVESQIKSCCKCKGLKSTVLNNHTTTSEVILAEQS